MGLGCLFGAHHWDGFKCSSCGKTVSHKIILTALRTAASSGNIQTIEKALAVLDVNARGLDGSSALVLAAGRGQLEAVNYLLSRKADTELADGRGQTALIHAIVSDRKDIAAALLEAGAKPNACDRHGMTAIFQAAFHSNIDLIEMLMKAGADVNVKDLSGMTPLMCAASKGDLQTINLLLAAGADATARNFEGTNAHSIAKHYLHTAAAALLKVTTPASATLVNAMPPDSAGAAESNPTATANTRTQRIS